MKWELGRQNTGYKKKLLFQIKRPVKMDCYILKFEDGVGVTPHTDRVERGRHFRMNVTIGKPNSGAEFQCPNKIIDWWRVVVFRPDIHQHALTPAKGGALYLLSLGWVLP